MCWKSAPAPGSMTKYLCDAAHHVLSIELDERLIPLLTAFLAERDNFTLVQGDVMTLNLADVTKDLRKPLSVVANIPYYITTPLLTMLLASPIPIQRMALMVQKEVADKVLAQPATMAGGCSAFAASSTATRIWPWMCRQSALRPCRRWTARLSSCHGGKRPAVQVQEEADFFRVAQAAFALRRKTMTNGLCAAFHMERADAASLMQTAGLDERIRGEKLTLAEFGAAGRRVHSVEGETGVTCCCNFESFVAYCN